MLFVGPLDTVPLRAECLRAQLIRFHEPRLDSTLIRFSFPIHRAARMLSLHFSTSGLLPLGFLLFMYTPSGHKTPGTEPNLLLLGLSVQSRELWDAWARGDRVTPGWLYAPGKLRPRLGWLGLA